MNSFLLLVRAQMDNYRNCSDSSSSSNDSLILGLSIGGGLSALIILFFCTVVTMLCCLSVKNKNKKITPVKNSLNESLMGRSTVTASSYGIRYNKASNVVTIGINNSFEYESPMEEEDDTYIIPPFEEDAIYAQMEEKNIKYLDRVAIKLETLLGSGEFGEVYKGVWFSVSGHIEVAVKTLKTGSSSEDRIKFLQEVAIMAQFEHPNIVTMYGVVSTEEPVLLVLELLSRGDLKSHLLSEKNKHPTIDGHTLLSYSRQVVCGMVYLSNKKFVHRDLAARNVLVSKQGICKIADFGMARNILYESYYTSQGGRIPVKWTAPEALHFKTYTTASDVWSFGMLMYEIWSLGHKPFEDLKNKEVPLAIDSGYRLPPPPGCPRNIYSLMMECWHPESMKRPSFLYLRKELLLPDTTLLQWNEGDAENQEALTLGGNLISSKNLYMDLQNIYKRVS